MKFTGNDDKPWKSRPFYKQQTKFLGLGGCLQPNNSYKCVVYSLEQKLSLHKKSWKINERN